jgi:abhydrolase domain-containing protein 12
MGILYSLVQRLGGQVLQEMVFLARLQYPPLPRVPDLSNPVRFDWSQAEDREEWDSSSVLNFNIPSPAGGASGADVLGAWLMLPPAGRLEHLAASDTVLLYLHGNCSNRSMLHRIACYRFLLSLGYYVLAVDYRGFGDSSPTDLTESSVVADARAALAWLTDQLGEEARLVVWGHSLGSAIATRMVAELELEAADSPVSGLVLEGAFTNMLEMVGTYRLTSGLFSAVFDLRRLVEEADVSFETVRRLPTVRCPVLILHAEDDPVVPHQHSVELEAAAERAGKGNVERVSYPAALGLSHCFIHRALGLASLVRRFVARL